jgi:hypothetical protein
MDKITKRYSFPILILHGVSTRKRIFKGFELLPSFRTGNSSATAFISSGELKIHQRQLTLETWLYAICSFTPAALTNAPTSNFLRCKIGRKLYTNLPFVSAVALLIDQEGYPARRELSSCLSPVTHKMFPLLVLAYFK